MPKVHEGKLDAANRRFAVVVARFNSLITGKLLDGALDCLRRHGCPEDQVEVAWVPGSFELPLVAKRLAATGRFDAVLCLGAIIRSETPHFDFVANETARGIARVGLDSGKPVLFGVLTCNSLEQAVARSRSTAAGGEIDKGREVARATIATLASLRSIRLRQHQKIFFNYLRARHRACHGLPC